MAVSVLSVDDDPAFRQLLGTLFSAIDEFALAAVAAPEQALALCGERSFEIALVDLHFSEDKPAEGFELLRRLRELDSGLELIVLSSSRNFEDARKAMQAGAGDYLPKGFGRAELEHTLYQALRRRRWKRMEQRLVQRSSGDGLVGSSRAMRSLKERIGRFAPSDAPVLILGETGTGKELVAASLHAGSSDPAGAFVPVNCAALPQSTIDSFFFGHERGAFTGADRARGGVFEEADGGTLFLDEVNSLPLELQGRLLRVLQERKCRRLGASREQRVEFRLVTASNQPLEALVRQGSFREDLYYRIRVLALELPPLRERREDIPELTRHFCPGRELSSGLADFFQKHSWPGNVRELRNLLQALDVLADPGAVLDLRHLPDRTLEGFCASEPLPPGEEAVGLEDFEQEREAREREFLQRAYRSARGNVSAMARLLGLDRSHLHQKLVRLGVHRTRQGGGSGPA